MGSHADEELELAVETVFLALGVDVDRGVGAVELLHGEGEASYSARSSLRSTADLEYSPCLIALPDERSLPSIDVGPVE